MAKEPGRPIVEHILPVSSNLLAICFAVVALMSARKMSEGSLIDDCAATAALLFLGASIFSYASMRSATRSRLYEMWADWIFLAGLGFLVILTVSMVVGLLH